MFFRGLLNRLGLASAETDSSAAPAAEKEQSKSSRISETDDYIHVSNRPTTPTKQKPRSQSLAVNSIQAEIPSLAAPTAAFNKSPSSADINRILNNGLQKRNTRISSHNKKAASLNINTAETDPQEYKKFVHALYPNAPLTPDEIQAKIDDPHAYKQFVRELYPNVPLSPNAQQRDRDESIPLLSDTGLHKNRQKAQAAPRPL